MALLTSWDGATKEDYLRLGSSRETVGPLDPVAFVQLSDQATEVVATIDRPAQGKIMIEAKGRRETQAE